MKRKKILEKKVGVNFLKYGPKKSPENFKELYLNKEKEVEREKNFKVWER